MVVYSCFFLFCCAGKCIFFVYVCENGGLAGCGLGGLWFIFFCFVVFFCCVFLLFVVLSYLFKEWFCCVGVMVMFFLGVLGKCWLL